MKNLVVILALLGMFSAFSCKETKRAEADSKEKVNLEEPTKMEHVMKIHDEVMPKMGTLGKLVGQLKPLADSLGINSAEAKAMKDLQDANKAMMDWMQGFGNRFDSEEIMKGKELSDEKKKWLLEEEEKVIQVKNDINTSIKKAQELLSQQ
ncbi:hypothetical protein SAMN04488009_2471 [Maribacter sedimenticola]|uniref:Viral A-type inclusion protein n=1 Tax=Maribacter sedimenticola TaxID=228956 RepID=A0ABY1SIQ9_9FLAO|nr:hypothetical protein [Maribacter sedimenticola]SNR56644.1 hypothetical protein SAMN04488009_2471 [Maribacter sedimenticola]